MLPLGLFRSRVFATCCFLVLMVGFGLIGTFFFLSLFLQNIQHDSVLGAGLRLLPAVLVVTLVAPFTGRLAGRFGPKYFVAVGMALVGSALLLFNVVGADTPYAHWWPLLSLLGLGVACTQSPTIAALMGSVPRERGGLASATGNMSQQVGGVLGVALLSSIVSTRFAGYLDAHSAELPLPGDLRRQLAHSATSAGSVQVPVPVDPGVLRRLIEQSFMDGLHGALTVAGVVYLAGALAALIFLPVAKGNSDA
jgi:MFS family permease